MDRKIPPEGELAEYLKSFDLERLGVRAEVEKYIHYHLLRFRRTVELVPRLDGKVKMLELGAAPFMMSLLIKRYLGYEITPANYYGDYGESFTGELEQSLTSEKYGETHNFAFKMFNLEKDTFPYEDGEFDICLCCEILEHLAHDPSHMLREIHRILKPGGLVILTTPNAVRLDVLYSGLETRKHLQPLLWQWGVRTAQPRIHTLGSAGTDDRQQL